MALTLAEYAAIKQLPLEFLKSLGLRNTPYSGAPAVRIPYFGRDGEKVAVKFRVAAEGDNKLLWKRGAKPCLYGLDRHSVAVDAGFVVIVEGESDTQTALHHGIPVLGLPGATNWDEARDAPHFDDIPLIYVVIEPDRGGETVKGWLATSAIRSKARLVHLPLKDLSALHLKHPDPEEFRKAWDAALQSAIPVEETDEERLARLAGLSPLQYDRVRKEEAAAAGVGLGALDDAVKKHRAEHVSTDADGMPEFLRDTEPWSDRVDGAELLNRIVETIEQHMVLPKGAASAIALWVVHCHAHDCFAISPILSITSPAPECGKSTLLTIISAMVPRALAASNVTPSTIFRAVEAWRPTLLIDEADTFLTENHEMRGILNSGHQKATAYVLRSVDTGDGFEPQRYRTWAPKAIAMIKTMSATLVSRSIRIELQRKARGANVKSLRADRLDHLAPLGQQAARWVADHQIQLAAHDPDMPAELGNRLADNWRPLITIADVAGGDWPERAREIARGDRVPVGELGIMLLEDIKRIFEAERVDRIPSAVLANKLVLEEDKPWVEYSYGKQISTRQIAELLAPFKIIPNTIRVGTTTPKGYLLKQFLDAFAVYTPDLSATPPQASESAKNQEKSSATEEIVLRHKKPERSSNSAACGGVAAKTLPSGEHHKNSPPKANGNGRNRCGHCGGSGDHIFKALDPDSNSHGWFHRECLKARAADHQKGPLS
jgi:Protein of unknown function (DUF3631)